jgi:hypothetical protein
MNYLDAALRFNQRCPKGSRVEVALRSGERMLAKTMGPAFVWAGLALVELEGAKGPYEVAHVRLVDEQPRLTETLDVESTNEQSEGRPYGAAA